jgi:hypothetical protein
MLAVAVVVAPLQIPQVLVALAVVVMEIILQMEMALTVLPIEAVVAVALVQ